MSFQNNIDLCVTELDCPFTHEELIKGLRMLKNNKASGFDMICNEMLKMQDLPQRIRLVGALTEDGKDIVHVEDEIGKFLLGLLDQLIKNNLACTEFLVLGEDIEFKASCNLCVSQSTT